MTVLWLVGLCEGLERLQQLMDAMTDESLVIRLHIYRVRDDQDAHQTVQRHHAAAAAVHTARAKYILVDLPTSQCEQFLKLQVRLCAARGVDCGGMGLDPLLENMWEASE